MSSSYDSEFNPSAESSSNDDDIQALRSALILSFPCFLDIGFAYGNMLSEELSNAYTSLLKSVLGNDWNVVGI